MFSGSVFAVWPGYVWIGLVPLIGIIFGSSLGPNQEKARQSDLLALVQIS